MLEQTGNTDIEKALDFLEDYTLTTNLSRCQNYLNIKNALESECAVRECVLQRLLAVCTHDLKEDMKYAVNTLNIISLVLKRIKSPTQPELLQSALAILHIIKTTAAISKVQALQTLCFDTLLLYPDVTYNELVTSHDLEITEVFDMYFHQGTPVNLRLMPFSILHKILKTLPPEIKATYVKKNLCIWFSEIIPTIMTLIPSHSLMMSRSLDVLEMLTDELETIDYSDNPHWQTVLECIYVPQRYPTVMKSLLESGSECWHRLWIVFVRLLKEQITMNKSKVGSPINSMLPVVEMAFKMDVTNRCRAFQCWTVLTDNFSKEQNGSFISKRIKLLIIPLKSNNAKVEDTALAKFDSWWHLIRKFETKNNKLFDLIFVPFLHFCFGNPKNANENNIVIPGQLTLLVKKQCVEAFVEATGHVDCEGCVSASFPCLAQRILTPKLLYDYLTEWLHGLKSVIKIFGSNSSENATKQVTCTWKSFLYISLKLQEDHKKLVFRELLCLLSQLVQECKTEGVHNVIFNVLLPALFGCPKFKSLLCFKDNPKDVIGPLHRILRLVLKPPFFKFYSSSDTVASVARLRPITNALFDQSQCSPNDSISWLLPELPSNDNGLILWTALMESITKAKYDLNQEVMKTMIMWPLKNMEHFQNVQYPATVWNSAFNATKLKLSGYSIDKDISVILKNYKFTPSSCLLSLYALLQIIKEALEKHKNVNCDDEAELLVNILTKINKHESVIIIIPAVVDCLVMILTKINDGKSASLAEFALTAANYSMKIITEATKSKKNEDLLTYLEKLLKTINELFKADGYAKFKSIILNQLIVCSTSFKQQDIKNIICTILKTILNKSKETEVPLYSMVQNAIAAFEKQENNSDKDKFTTPKSSSTKKSKKKKEPSIVNTIVENGEEYVVVKSNWKFNPRKLTENQKEKFQKKSEIPALYQDLSQSQDEFKMTSWKTESQDASSTTNNSNSDSKSTSETCNNDYSTMLKQLPNTGLVPKIMENIFSDNIELTDSRNNKTTNENIQSDNRSPKSIKMLSLMTPKQTKSPRVALKDRVFQNVRILMEKSSLSPETKLTKELNQTITDTVSKTPLSKDTNDNVAYSAPSKLPADRPSRVKRKPKKYEADFEEHSLIKKRRPSATSSDTPTELNSEELTSEPKSSSEEYLIKNAIHSDKERLKTVIINKNNDIMKDETDVDNVVDPVTICDIIVIDDNDDVDISETDKKSHSQVENTKEIEETETTIIPQENIVDKTPSKSIIKDSDEVMTPVPENKETVKAKSTTKKSTKKSRIEKNLAIDMVEGHPFLQIKDKRATRKSVVESVTSNRRKALTEKLNKFSQSDSKVETKNQRKQENFKTMSEDKKYDLVKQLFTLKDTQENNSNLTENLPMSEDFIESSQDSTITTISVKSNKSLGKKNARIVLSNLQGLVKSNKKTSDTQSLLENSNDSSTNINPNQNINDDIEFSQNKSIPQENDLTDLTADMDTEPMIEKVNSDDVILIKDSAEPIQVSSDETCVDTDTQCTANADTQPMDPNKFSECIQPQTEDFRNKEHLTPINQTSMNSQVEEPTSTTSNVTAENDTEDGLTSPFNDEVQRNEDFLNSTLEISPIKIMSPVPDLKQSPENSNDYVVIKLSSPVQSNGEPFEKSGSPEIFTEEKISPDKRDQSPPRTDVPVNISSPTSSLSLKKNRPQVRSGGRAAQMLGLCVPDSLQTLKSNDRTAELDEPKKTFSTPARRNLLILNNCGENNENSVEENEETCSSFLKFKRTLPSADSSPSVPILKRKLIEITDETTASPASKRKRVSFHDPPVSTTVSVQKYIEPLGTKSPQSSVLKKQERQTRMISNMKSPKKLENLFKLDSALVTTVECFDANTPLCSDDTQTSSLEQTPAVEIVKTSDLNDTDPICLELVNCTNPISDIAAELSSPTMKSLLLKELEANIKTIGDLAALSELEVNRLCIKAPKVKVAKKVLSEYAAKQNTCSNKIVSVNNTLNEEIGVIPHETDIQKEKEKSFKDQNMQTDVNLVAVQTQTSKSLNISRLVQTDESQSKSTSDVIKSCLLERSDFIEELTSHLDDASKMKMLDKVSFEPICNILQNKITNSAESRLVIESMLNNQRELDSQSNTNFLSFLQNYICERYNSSDLILFCSNILKTVHDKTT